MENKKLVKTGQNRKKYKSCTFTHIHGLLTTLNKCTDFFLSSPKKTKVIEPSVVGGVGVRRQKLVNLSWRKIIQ